MFLPKNLPREATRQKGMEHGAVPEICVLDPDGDIVRRLVGDGGTRPEPLWVCYHSEMYRFEHAGETFGIVGCAVIPSWRLDCESYRTVPIADQP